MVVHMRGIDSVVDRLEVLLAKSNGRLIVGLVGKPGAGKSTVAEELRDRMKLEDMVVIPMDGYHLSQKVLEHQGIANRKGAPDTFDVKGFVSLLRRIRTEVESTIYFPIFHREIEDSVAAEGFILPESKLIIVEGNYLLTRTDGWAEVGALLDESWYLEVDDELRLNRLITRHASYGKSPQEAKSWAEGSDERNAEIVVDSSSLADGIIYLLSDDKEEDSL